MGWELSLGCSLLLLPACPFSGAGERRGPRDGDQERGTKRWELREDDQEKGPRDGDQEMGKRDRDQEMGTKRQDQATESKASGAAHSEVSCPITPFVLLPLIAQSTGEDTCTCPAKSHF